MVRKSGNGTSGASRWRAVGKIALWVAGVVVALYLIALLFQAPPVDPVSFFASQDVTILAHGGGQGHAPDNTIPAFDTALELGAHVLEMDLQLTADGHVVVLHDGTVDRTTDGSGRVRDLSLEQIQQLDGAYNWTDEDGNRPFRGRGVRIPALEEVFIRYRGIPMVIELKTDSGEEIIEATSRLIDRYRTHDHVLVASFDSDYLDRFRELQPHVPTNLGMNETATLYALQLFGLHRWYRPRGAVLQVPQRFSGLPVLIPGFRRAAAHRGLDLQVWTVNDYDTMVELLEMGVDGLITDFPDRAVRAVEATGRDRR